MSILTRRHFVYTAGVVTAAQATRVMGANDRVHVAIVGLGGRGQDHMKGYLSLPESSAITALCDVNQAALERATATVVRAGQPAPKGFKDMRELFADKSVDAVSMPLPNHWHALATIWACQAGKDVYIEKPASHNIFEGLKMVEAARKYKRMVQVGSQSRSETHVIKAIDLVKQGAIGKVYLAKGLCYKRRKSIGHVADAPVPPGLDWDRFLGPAPMRPYNELRFKYNWHWFWDTGNGDIGNQGIHQYDIARWGLGRGVATSAVSTGGKYVYVDDQETPNTQISTHDYGDAELMFEVRGILTGGEGGLVNPNGGNVVGNLFYGSEGWLAVGDRGFQLYKGEHNEKVMEGKPERVFSTAVHMDNFLKAVKSRDYHDLAADIAIGVDSVIQVHAANVSYRLGRKVKLDPQTKKFVGDAEADKLWTRKYRAPYIVPEKV
jgi:predicted dehydrogenase